MGKIFSYSRWIVILPVIGSFLSGIVVLIFNSIRLAQIIVEVLMLNEFTNKTLKNLILGLLEVTDVYLLGLVFYLISMGLYELFFDSEIKLPDWLEIHSLDDLKSKLVGVVVLVMTVQYLGWVLSNPGEKDLLLSGAGIAIMIFAATFFVSQKKLKKNYSEKQE